MSASDPIADIARELSIGVACVIQQAARLGQGCPSQQFKFKCEITVRVAGGICAQPGWCGRSRSLRFPSFCGGWDRGARGGSGSGQTDGS